MLQWMGGSRKKVTTSRKSTQKRQKQYFEQRKRQQQLQNSNGVETYFDNKTPCTQSRENNRSLDILSLLNLSKNGQDFTSKSSEGRGNSNGQHTTTNSQTANCLTTIQLENENICQFEHDEIRETSMKSGTVTNQLEKTECPQEFLFDFSSKSHPDTSKGDNEKDSMKMTADHKLSFVDILGYDGQNSNSRGNLVHEDHVAFSIEGLGKVEMETPPHSPQHTTRNFYGCPAPPKIFKGSHSFKNLNSSLKDQFHELDDMAVGVDHPTDSYSYLAKPFLNLKQKIMGDKECFLHEAEDFSRNDEFYDSKMDQDRFKWHGKSSFLDDNFLDDNCDISWKNWSCDMDSYMPSRKCDKPDFSFEDIHMQKRRARVNTPGCFDVSGSSSSSSYKHQIHHPYNFMSSNTTRYRCNSEFSEIAHCSDWPSFTTEDSRDQFHLSSEDSFLSHPVRHEGTNNSSFNTTERQKFRQHAYHSRSHFSMKNKSFSQEFHTNFSTPKDDWSFEERCNIENPKQSYRYTSPKASHFDHKHWTKEPFDLEDEKPSSSKQSYTYTSQKASHFDHKHWTKKPFDSEKVAFYQHVSSPINSPKSINVECGDEEPHNDLFLEEEKGDSNLQFQKSVSTRESESVTLPAITSKLHQDKESSNETNHSNETTMNEEESQVKKTPELTPCQNALLSPERSEGGSSSVEMPHKVEHSNALIQHKEIESDVKVMVLGGFVLQLL